MAKKPSKKTTPAKKAPKQVVKKPAPKKQKQVVAKPAPAKHEVKHVEHTPAKKASKHISVITKKLAKITDPKDIAIFKNLIQHWEEVNQPTKSEIVSTPTKEYEEILEKMKKTLAKVSQKK